MRAREFLLGIELALSARIKAAHRQLARLRLSFPADFAVEDEVAQRKSTSARRLARERVAIELVRRLPVAAWWCSHHGLGPYGLAQILAATGDLARYPNPAKVWKRMSVHVVNGRAARLVRGEDAKLQQFVPERRRVLHVIGDSLIKGNRGGLYYQLYVARKAYEFERLIGVGKRRKLLSHLRAKRYMEKRVLLHLWKAWRHSEHVPWGDGSPRLGLVPPISPPAPPATAAPTGVAS